MDARNATCASAERPVPITLRTFRDYGPDFGWFAHCLGCFRDRRFTDDEVEHRLGLDTDVDAVRRALRCTRCGARENLLYRYYRGGMHEPGEGAYRAP